MLYVGTPERTASWRWRDKMWREAQKPENLGVWKVGAGLAHSPLLLIARGTGQHCNLPSRVEFDGLQTKKITNFVTPWIAFLWGKLAAAFWTTFLIQHFAEVRVRTANKVKDNSQLNQYVFKIPADFPTQCSAVSLALHCEKTSRTSTARLRTLHQRHWSCHWEATLAGYNFPPEFPDTQRWHKRPLSVTRYL